MMRMTGRMGACNILNDVQQLSLVSRFLLIVLFIFVSFFHSVFSSSSDLTMSDEGTRLRHQLIHSSDVHVASDRIESSRIALREKYSHDDNHNVLLKNRKMNSEQIDDEEQKHVVSKQSVMSSTIPERFQVRSFISDDYDVISKRNREEESSSIRNDREKNKIYPNMKINTKSKTSQTSDVMRYRKNNRRRRGMRNGHLSFENEAAKRKKRSNMKDVSLHDDRPFELSFVSDRRLSSNINRVISGRQNETDEDDGGGSTEDLNIPVIEVDVTDAPGSNDTNSSSDINTSREIRTSTKSIIEQTTHTKKLSKGRIALLSCLIGVGVCMATAGIVGNCVDKCKERREIRKQKEKRQELEKYRQEKFGSKRSAEQNNVQNDHNIQVEGQHQDTFSQPPLDTHVTTGNSS